MDEKKRKREDVQIRKRMSNDFASAIFQALRFDYAKRLADNRRLLDENLSLKKENDYIKRIIDRKEDVIDSTNPITEIFWSSITAVTINGLNNIKGIHRDLKHIGRILDAPEMIEELKHHNLQDDDGNTCLHLVAEHHGIFAEINGRDESIEYYMNLWINAGALLTIRNNEGKTPIDILRERKVESLSASSEDFVPEGKEDISEEEKYKDRLIERLEVKANNQFIEQENIIAALILDPKIVQDEIIMNKWSDRFRTGKTREINFSDYIDKDRTLTFGQRFGVTSK